MDAESGCRFTERAVAVSRCRSGTSAQAIDALRVAFRVLYKEGRTLSSALERIEADYATIPEVVEFVTEIESQFDMQFSDQDMQDSRFVTIAGISELIEQRAAQAASAPVATAQIEESR